MENSDYPVIEIRDVNSKKKLICLGKESASFVLYNAELRKFGIKEGGSISSDTYLKIIELLKERARNRSLYIVTRKDITESQLRSRLKEDGYAEEIIDETVVFMKEHSFINDVRYAGNYVWCKADVKSRRQIETYLYGKGISREIIESACDEYYASNEDAEEELIRKLIEKRRVDVRTMSYEEKSKLMAYLARKGFGFDNMQYVIDEMKR